MDVQFQHDNNFSISSPWSEGQLRIIDPNSGLAGELPFEFEVDKNNHDYNQRRYEALGEVRQHTVL